MGIDKKWNINIGRMEKGPRNLISDVEGVTVGHCTLSDGNIQTGVTAIIPHTGDIFHQKVMAASHVINGFGKSVGLVEIEELGFLETPILLTNTLSVGTVSTALVRYMLERNPDIGDTTGTVNPVVCECNDGGLNDIRGLLVTEENARTALDHCQADFSEGAVGAGRGMRCHGLKGGIGSSSRVFQLDGRSYTIGTLVLTNHGLYQDLTVAGIPVGKMYEQPIEEKKDKGSVITILATDAPLCERQLKRICKRAVVGLSRTGSYMTNGSGEIVIAFTVKNRIPHYSDTAILPYEMVHDESLDIIFRGVAETVEEAVISSLLHAEAVTGRNGRHVVSLREILEKENFCG